MQDVNKRLAWVRGYMETFLHFPFNSWVNLEWDSPGVPVVKNPPCNARDVGSIPGQGTKIPYAMWHGQKNTKSSGVFQRRECPYHLYF